MRSKTLVIYICNRNTSWMELVDRVAEMTEATVTKDSSHSQSHPSPSESEANNKQVLFLLHTVRE